MDKELWEKLREPQKEAYDKMKRYIAAFENKTTSKSALVQMPTGSGKTGVAACIAHFLTKEKNVLIVAPRVALRSQLARAIEGVFFTDRGYSKVLPKVVIEAESNKVFPLPESNKILITTIQKLHTLSTKNRKAFEQLQKRVNLVLFDEGHYEPSPAWSSSIRSFNCPKIIFTATPFRNDFKAFHIESKHVYSYSFDESVNTGILRNVVVTKKPQIPNPIHFVNDVLEEFDNLLKNDIPPESKMIIRCDDATSILQIAHVLNGKKKDFIAIHETFDKDGKEKWKYKHVPNPSTIKAKIWVHQYKLLEGIDDPNFRVLATFDKFLNARQLIQQVGRIIRNPNKVKGEKAYFLDHSNGIQEKMWNEYLQYDLQASKNPTKAIGDIFEEILGQLPEMEYMNGSFKKRFDLSEKLDPLIEEIKLPLRCNLIGIENEFKSDKLCQFLEERFDEEDYKFKKYQLAEFDATFYLYIQLSHSHILTDRYFLNISLNVCLFKKISDNILAYYDSLNFVPINNPQLKTDKAIDPKFLKKLISENDTSRLTSISLKNSNLGNKSIRTHAYSAASINEITPFLDDHAQIISNITGYSFEGREADSNLPILKRRYIGINKGRVSEGNAYVLMSEYFGWITKTSYLLNDTKRKPLNTFRRYSKEKENVTKTNPLHILLDFSEIEQLKFKDIDSRERDAVFEDLSSEIDLTETPFKFSINEFGLSLQCLIKYDVKRKKYLISSSAISGKYFTDGKTDLIKYLNESQSFRVIPEEENCIYIDGNFYQPSIKIGKEFDKDNFHVGHILHDDSFLFENGDEKGKKCKADKSGWEDNSLFDFISRLGKDSSLEKMFGKPDILICDDLGTECADFILSDEERVVFIHAKGHGKDISNYSASKLMDVCGQATKNIQYLSMFNDLKPKKLYSWDRKWFVKDIGEVKSRKIIGKDTPKETWEQLYSRINNPLKTKEVWLVLGRILSKSALISHLEKENVTHEAVQAAILLHGTMTNVSSIGAKLRVFCHP